jgi:hypothetical protein
MSAPPTSWRLARRNGELILQAGSFLAQGQESGIEWNDVPTMDLDALDGTPDPAPVPKPPVDEGPLALWASSRAAADQLGVSERTLHRWRAASLLKPGTHYRRKFPVPNSPILYDIEAVNAVMRKTADLLQQLSAPAPVVVPVAVSDALIKMECALSDIAEGEETDEAPNTLEWAEKHCAETLAIIRPVMRQHGIRTSEWPPATPPEAQP